jgi:rSAM/selenodomain-associated transferase 2
MSTDPKTFSISIIIPARNEAENFSRILPGLLAVPGIEVLVVDGNSSDGTAATAEALGARVLRAYPDRASQMNIGAGAARGDILLFLHADTSLAPGFKQQVRGALGQPGVAAGAFRFAIAGPGWGLRLIEKIVNLRARFLQMPYGDQALFVRADLFASLGGFPSLPVMEDFEMVRRLKKRGRIAILSLAATTSARRWEKLGALRTTLVNQAMVIGYLLGVNPRKLAEWYRVKRG